MDKQGRIYTQSKVPRLKRYLDEMQGQAVHDNWHDIPPINSQAKERTGWPTQKPLALYRRIIEASSDEGDVVLDAFAGCATTAVAAEGLERKWVAIDLEEKAYEVLKSRLAKEGFTVNGEAVGEGNGRLELASGEQILPRMRFLPTTAAVDQWRISSDVVVGESAIGQIRARRLADGRIELGFRDINGEAVSPGILFLPAQLPTGVWLRSGEIEVPPAPEPVAGDAAEEEASE